MSPASPDGHEVASKKVLVLAPFHHEFGELDSGAATRTIFDDHNETVGCPMYDVVYLEDSNAGVEAFKTIGKYGIVHIDSHGGIMWGELIVVTGTSADDLASYQPDLVKGRLVMASVHGKQALAITPKFLAYYVGAMPSSLVFMATCKSADDPGMSDVLLAKGAQTYLGFTGLVKSKFALAKVKYFYESWVEDPASLVTTGEVFDGACSDGACWELAGASDLEAPSDEGLQDRSFEQATLAAWSLQGDVRVVRQLGEFAPTDGSYMALVSTGLGFVANSGSISQQTCLPTDTKTLRFDWSFTSEEFLEWCGSIYQDVFRVDLVDAGGSIANVFYREVDDLCGLVFPVEFSFDRGDAWSTGWQSEAIDISTVAAGNGGRPIALRFSAGDIGDSIYDTAVLVDRVDLER
jgi:hypothetical protein